MYLGGWDDAVKYPECHAEELGLSCGEWATQWFLTQEFCTLACLKVNREQTQWMRLGMQTGYLTVAVFPGVCVEEAGLLLCRLELMGRRGQPKETRWWWV